jgi:hypothetical protein
VILEDEVGLASLPTFGWFRKLRLPSFPCGYLTVCCGILSISFQHTGNSHYQRCLALRAFGNDTNVLCQSCLLSLTQSLSTPNRPRHSTSQQSPLKFSANGLYIWLSREVILLTAEGTNPQLSQLIYSLLILTNGSRPRYVAVTITILTEVSIVTFWG